MSHLCLVQIGPVQPFIAAARRIQDLYVGSALLSAVAAAGVQAARAEGGDLIFPVAQNEQWPASVPHRFVFTTEHDPEVVCARISAAMRAYWRQEVVERVRHFLRELLRAGHWEARFDAQSEQWPEITWVAVRYDPTCHGACFAAASRAMAARRRVSAIAVERDTPGTQKCTLTGASAALLKDANEWEPVRKAVQPQQEPNDELYVIRNNENLGALAAIKRLARHAGWRAPAAKEAALKNANTSALAIASGKAWDRDWRAPAEAGDERHPRYLAVLHLDGDHMGDLLAAQQRSEHHRAISAALADFADNIVPVIVKDHCGILIYAGGDDVLALLPANSALPCAAALNEGFRTHMRACLERIGSARSVSASAGISIVPYKHPLDLALDAAREAEKLAKQDYKRNAVVVREQRGEIRLAGARWQIPSTDKDVDTTIAGLVATLTEGFMPGADGTALWSSSLGYDLQVLAHQLGTPAPETPESERHIMAQACEAEVRRILRRRFSASLSQATAREKFDDLAQRLIAFGVAPSCGWETLAHWVILARFLREEKIA